MKKFAVVFLLLSMLLGMFAGCNTVGHEHNHTEEEPDSTQNQPTEEQTTLSEWEKQKQQYTNAETTYEKVYWEVPSDCDFSGDKILIVIRYPYNNRDYTLEDFAEIGCINVRQLGKKVKPMDSLLYELTLPENDKEKAIIATRKLEEKEYIYCANPAQYGYVSDDAYPNDF